MLVYAVSLAIFRNDLTKIKWRKEVKKRKTDGLIIYVDVQCVVILHDVNMNNIIYWAALMYLRRICSCRRCEWRRLAGHPWSLVAGGWASLESRVRLDRALLCGRYYRWAFRPRIQPCGRPDCDQSGARRLGRDRNCSARIVWFILSSVLDTYTYKMIENEGVNIVKHILLVLYIQCGQQDYDKIIWYNNSWHLYFVA